MLDVRDAEPLSTLPYYDLACKNCWRGGESTPSEAEEADLMREPERHFLPADGAIF